MDDISTTAPSTGQPEQTTNTTPSYDFNAALSPDLRDNPSIQKFGGSPEKLAQSYLSLERLMGQGRVVVPKNAEDVAGWDAYDKAFGIPDSADKYELTGREGMDLTEFKALMKENHINQATAQKLLDAHIAEFDSLFDLQSKMQEEAKTQATQELRKEWGMKYDANLKKANNVLHQLAGNDYEYFNERIGNDPKFIKLLAQIGESMSEGSIGGGAGQVGSFTKTPAEAKAELDAILNDPNDAYWAGARNHRDNAAWCREHSGNFVSEEERRARVSYVTSLMQMAG